MINSRALVGTDGSVVDFESFGMPMPSGATRIVAVVIWQWRQPRHPAERTSDVREAFRRRAREQPELPPVLLPPGFDSGSDPGGPREVAFSSSRRIVRLLGQEFSLPTDGRALVLLVRDGRAGTADATIVTHAMEIPPERAFRPDPSLSKKENVDRMLASLRPRAEASDAVLKSDPLIRDFLNGSA